MTHVDDSTDYERFVQAVMQVLLDAQGLDHVKVEHNVHIVASDGVERQVDIYWEYRQGCIRHRVIVECRHYRSALSIKHVDELAGRLTTLPGYRGMLVTSEGFQAGALEAARGRGIELKIVRQPRNADYEGRIREIHTELRLVCPTVSRMELRADKVWLASLPDGGRGLLNPSPAALAAGTIEDRATGSRQTLRQLVAGLPETDGPAGLRLRWDDGWLHIPGNQSVRLVECIIEFSNVPFTQTLISGGTDRAVLSDPVAGTSLFIAEDGRISGDLEDEGLAKPKRPR